MSGGVCRTFRKALINPKINPFYPLLTFAPNSAKTTRLDRLKKPLQPRPLIVFLPVRGEVTERPKVHDWKSCVVQATGGSNPPLSASFYSSRLNGFVAVRSDSRVPCNGMPPTPSGPEGSSGSGFSVCRGSAWLSLVPAMLFCLLLPFIII